MTSNFKVGSRPVVPGCAGCAMAPRFWHINYVTLFQPGGTDYAHLIITGTHGFSDLLTALGQSASDFTK